MIHGHHDHVVMTSEVRSVCPFRIAGPSDHASRMHPDHHRPLMANADLRRPDVETKTVLAHIHRLFRNETLQNFRVNSFQGRILEGHWSELRSIAHSGPGRRTFRRQESVHARRGCSVGYSTESVHAVNSEAAHFARFGFHHRTTFGRHHETGAKRSGRGKREAARRGSLEK